MATQVGLVVADQSGERFIKIDQNQRIYSIGRHVSNDVIVRDEAVSRYHARLIFWETYWKVLDGTLQHGPSKNGLWIGDKRVKAVQLKPSDRVCLGKNSSVTLCIFDHDSSIFPPADRPTLSVNLKTN
jgi:pSer/pThr/pTyr-binding forkhead associated (FHA) protein